MKISALPKGEWRRRVSGHNTDPSTTDAKGGNMSRWRFGTLQVIALVAMMQLASSPRAGGASYKEMREYLGDLRNGSQDHWFATLDLLAKSFSDVCGDTFCEGDYSDLSPLSTYCVVSSLGVVASCVWLFAGSHANVSATSGTLGLKRKVFTCKLPLARATTALALVDALAASGNDDLTQRVLPGA
jgi:hypothetical protein